MQATKDVLFIGILFVLLSILNVTTMIILSQQHVNKAYLGRLMEDTGVCTLRASGAVNTQEIPYTPEAIESYYKRCINERG